MKRIVLSAVRWMPPALGIVVAAVLGCTRADGPSGTSGSELVEVTAVVRSVQLRLSVPAAVRSGAAVPIALTATNVGSEPVEFNVSDRLEFDVVVRDVAGSVVWQRSGGRPTTGTVVLAPALAPGATRKLEASWNQRDDEGQTVRPGSYTIEGIVLAGLPLSGIRLGPLSLTIRR